MLFKLHLWKRVISNTKELIVASFRNFNIIFWGLIPFFMICLLVNSALCSSSSQLVPSHFPQVPNVFPNMFTIAPHFISYALSNVVFFEPTLMGQYWGLYVSMFGVNAHILGSLQSFETFLWWANQRGSLQKEILNLECTPQLINIDHTMVYHDEVSRLSLKIIIKSFQKL
jgi:hypothetical protein